jgi:hypothetical protein
LETYQNRDRALIDAEEKIKRLIERNAQLEAEAKSANSRAAMAIASADERMRKKWAELARQLAIRSKSNVTLRDRRERNF